jgi:hypothetical protein
MKNYTLKKVSILLAVVALLLVAMTALVGAEGPVNVEITSPTNGETVSGLKTVTGSIDFPDFLKYDVFLQGGGNMIWVATGYSPVVNGNLLRLDTKAFGDGGYQMIIRKVKTDSNYTDFAGPSFTINNGQRVGNPTSEVEAAYMYAVADKARVRVKNCSGENLLMDYHSPEGFHDAGEISLTPKVAGAPICSYVDLAWVPGQYQGTATGDASNKGYGFDFNAEAGKVYQITYNDADAGRWRFFVEEVSPDTLATTDAALVASAEETAGQAPAAASQSADTAPQPTKDNILPDTGQAAQTSAPFMIFGIALLALMVVGGVMAIRHGKRAI